MVVEMMMTTTTRPIYEIRLLPSGLREVSRDVRILSARENHKD